MGTTTPQKLDAQAGKEERAVPCPACGGRLLEVLLTHADIEAEQEWLLEFYKRRVCCTPQDLKDRVEFTQSEPTNIVRCCNCDTLLRDPQPTPEALSKLYTADTYGLETLRDLAANQYPFFKQKLARIKNFLPPEANVLEIGSFVGGFLQAATEQGWQPTGLDIGEETVNFMRQQGLMVMQGDIAEASLPAASWDGIFIWNTFDQLPQPAQVLQRASALLKPQGLLVLRVPNGQFEMGCLGLRRQQEKSKQKTNVLLAQAYNNFLTFPYLTGYTPDSLRRILERHGFTIETIIGDTILKLVDKQTLPFAVQEEQRVKRAIMRFCRYLEAATGLLYYPWLDVLARKQQRD